MIIHHDFLGQPIVAPCQLVYPVRRGSMMELRLVTVTAVRADGVVCGYNPNGRRLQLKNLQNCIVVRKEN